jgi:hypothetical protein
MSRSPAYTVDKKFMIEGNISQDKWLYRKGIIAYMEYQSFCPFVGTGPPSHPLLRKRMCLPPHLGSGGSHTPLRGRGWRGPNSDEGTDALVLYVY